MTERVSVGDLPRLVFSDEHAEELRCGAAVHVWLLDVRELGASRLGAWSAAFPGEEEQRRAGAMVHADMRRDHLAGRLTLRVLLSAYWPGVPPEAWVLARAEGGRPIIRTPRSDTGTVPSFSISHSEGYLALSLHAAGQSGVDIESASREMDMMGLARRYFSAAEVEQLESLSGEALRTGFLRCWTLKEASVKADGAGLAGELERRAFLWTRGGEKGGGGEEEQGNTGRILTRSPDARRWQYWSWKWRPSRMLAVALRHPADWQGAPVTCRPFTLSLPDGNMAEATADDACESAVV